MIDVIILGAGTAGAAAARACATRGLRVLVLERGHLERAGAQWVNGVPRQAFDRNGIPQPEGNELTGAGGPFHLVAGGARLTIDPHDMLEVDMGPLGQRLLADAVAAGADVRGNVDAERTDEAEFRCGSERVSARWVVDATGLAGAALLGQPKVDRRDLCAAAQQCHLLGSAADARAYFDAHGVAFGDTLSFAGEHGGFSVCNVRVHGDRVYLLTGSIPADGHKPGLRILEDFVAAHPWIGERVAGGARAIPLALPPRTLGKGRVALIGDAGRQVFAAHGSGIAAQLDAATILAEQLQRGAGPEAYARLWWRRWGGLFAAYDSFRRFSQGLPPGRIEALIAAGLLDRDLARAGLEQRHPQLSMAILRRLVPAALRAPSQLAALSPALWGMAAARVAARFPRRDP